MLKLAVAHPGPWSVYLKDDLEVWLYDRGFCADGVVNGVLVDLEGPDAFTVYKDHLKTLVCDHYKILISARRVSSPWA